MSASVLFREFPWRVSLYGGAIGAVLGAVHRGALVALSLRTSGQLWFFLPLVPMSALRGTLIGALVGLGLGALGGLVLWTLAQDDRTTPEVERHRVVAGRACALVCGTTLTLLLLLAPEDELLDYLIDGGVVDLVLKKGIPMVLGTLAAWWIGQRMASRQMGGTASETGDRPRSSSASELMWGMLWRSVLWDTAASTVLGGMYGCAVLVVIFVSALGGGAGVRWAPIIVAVVGMLGAIPGWRLVRGSKMRPLFGAVLGALVLVSLPGLCLVPFSMLALSVGGIVGGIYGLVMGLTTGLSLSVLTKVRHFPLADVDRHRREVVRVGCGVVGVLALVYPPLLWLSSGVNALTGGVVVVEGMVFAGFPALMLVFTAEWVGTLLAAWYAHRSGLSPESGTQGRFEQRVESFLASVVRIALRFWPRERRLLAASLTPVTLAVLVGVPTYRLIHEQAEDSREKKESVWMSPALGRLESSPQEPFVVLRNSNSHEVWNVAARQRVGTIDKLDLTYLTPSPNGRLVAGYSDRDGEYGAAPQEMQVVGVEDGSEVASLRIGEGAEDYEWSTDGLLLAVAIDKAVEVWRVRDGRLLKTINDRDIPNGTVGVLDWHPDGRVLAVQAVPGYVRLWDVGTGRRLATLGPGPRQVESVAFSPDGNLVAMSGNSVQLWDADEGDLVRELNGHVYVPSLAFSPDGDLLATGGSTGEIRLWRTSDGALLDTYLGHDPNSDGFNFVSALAFSSGGSRLFSYGDDGLVRVWPVEEGDA